MRIAALILGLFVSLLLFCQSCGLGLLGGIDRSLSENFGTEITVGTEESQGQAGIGMLAALIGLVGSGLAISKSRTSAVILGISAVMAILGGTSGGLFADLTVWGVIYAIAAGLAFFGRREIKKEGSSS